MNRTKFTKRMTRNGIYFLNILFLLLSGIYANAQEDAEKLNFVPTYLMVSTEKIGDAERWQKDFGSHAGKIDANGLMPIGIANDVEYANVVLVGHVVIDLEKAKKYIDSKKFKTDRKSAGVSGDATGKIYSCLDLIFDPSGNKKFFILTHSVKDYHLWRENLFANEREWLENGVKYVGIFRTLGKDEVSVVFTYRDLYLAKEYVSSNYQKNVLAKAEITEKPTSQFLQLNQGESEQNNEPEETISNSPDQLTLRLTTNADCSYTVNTGEEGSLSPGGIKRLQLPKGDYSFLFISTSNAADSVRVNYKVDKTNTEEILFADVQGATHKRIIKERSPIEVKDSANPYNMVLVKGGTFKMGNDNLTTEMKTRTVTVNDFYICKYEVTQKQWKEIMGNNPSHFQGCDNCPVENVSNNDAVEFIAKLNSKLGTKFRLPTEAEWEYAAKGGNQSKGYTYSGSSDINEVGWNGSNSYNETHPVGQLKPNELGLYDMTGNVIEWCSDWFTIVTVHYPNGSFHNPFGNATNSWKIIRGGSWSHSNEEILPEFRFKDEPTNRGRRTGFRLAMDK